jgi:hypothetical protein
MEQRRDDEEQHQDGDDTQRDLDDQFLIAADPKVVST